MALIESLSQSWSHDRAAWIASAAISIVLYAGVVIAIPVVLARLPADHFVRPRRPPRALAKVIRAAVGAVFVAAGIAMLFLPGPGILTILLGLSIIGGDLADRVARRLIARPRVLDAINAVRRKRGKEPLLAPPDDSA